VQEVHHDSLIIADSLQNTIPSRWTLQTSQHRLDTVVVTGVVVVPAKIITYTAKGFTMLVHDTSDNQAWGGLLIRVRYSSSTGGDTVAAIADGFMNPEAGDIVRITGLISEFPDISMNSATQFQPIAGIAIEVIGNKAVPLPVSKTVPDFYKGIFSGGKIPYTTGEPFEGRIIELTNVRVDNKINTLRGTFSMVDGSGNQISMLDASKYFTLAGGTTDHPYPDPTWTAIYNSPGFTNSVIDTIRGFITINSGSEAARGYRICPIQYGDIVFGKVLPTITTHRRYPIVVTPDSIPLVTVKAYTYAVGKSLASVELFYSIDNSPFVSKAMTYYSSDTTYRANLPQQVSGTFVRYFVKATDNDVPANSTINASSAFGGASSDTSKGFFFYNVLNRSLVIQDIQYTPFENGRTPYLGAVVSLSGIVTADTAHLQTTAPSGGTSTWYMQTGNFLWNGIWITGADSLMKFLRNGDSITVTGSVAENSDVTRLQYISSVIVHSSGNPIPPAIELPTLNFGSNVGNGNFLAEPYEGMLVRLNNVTVSRLDPTFADPSEYEVDDGTGPLIVQQSGKNKYSNIPGDTIQGKTLLKLGDHISSLTGIIYYSFNRYKFVPRNNADFGTITGVSIDNENILPAKFALDQNYPNPFNPTTNFKFSIANSQLIILKIYDVLGREVKTLVNETLNPGTYTVRWDASGVSSGVYFYRLIVNNGEFQQMKKMLLLK
jgi:hypothetical protein